MYQVFEASLADTGRLFRFMQAGAFGVDFNLKGFEYPWTLESRQRRKSERLLDVGAGYSPLQTHLAVRLDCEVWAEDSSGADSRQLFWARCRDPLTHIQANPKVKYVLERLGRPAVSSLPSGSFDAILSTSALEHVPDEKMPDVWRHMDLLLKPGGGDDGRH